MNKSVLILAIAAVAALPAVAQAQTKTVVIDGQMAAAALTPPSPPDASGKSALGENRKQDVLDMVKGASASVVMLPDLAGGAEKAP